MNPSKKDIEATTKTRARHQPSETVALLRPFEVLSRRRWQLLGCLLLVCSIAFAATALRMPMYEAVARVQVDTLQMSPATALFGGSGQGDINTQVELLQSRQVLGRTVEKLNGAQLITASLDQQIDVLRENIKVRPVRGSQLIDIVGVSNTGTQAAMIANRVAESYVEFSLENHHKKNQRIKAQMEKQVEQYDKEILELQERLNQYRREHKITGAHSELATTMNRISQIEARLTQAKLVRMELEGKQERLKKVDRDQADQVMLAEINDDPSVRSIQQTINTLEQREMQLVQAYLPGHQKLREVRGQIVELKSRLGQYKQVLAQEMLEEIAAGIVATVKEEEKYRQMLDEQKDVGVVLTEQQQGYQELLSELDMVRRFRADCISKIREFSLEEGFVETPVKIVDGAHAPIRSAGLSKAHQAASILLLGLLFSLGFIFAIDRLATSDHVGEHQVAVPSMGMPLYGYAPPGYWPMTGVGQMAGESRKETVASAQEVRPAVNIPLTPEVVGRVGQMTLGSDNIENAAFAARCRIVQTDQSSSPAASFRQVVGNLLSRFGQTRQNMVVTGAGDKIGKTTCACNIAILLAQSGRKVLLVEANPESPDLVRVFPDIADRCGMQDVLEDMTQIDMAVQQTDIKNLYVLGSGAPESQQGDWDESKIWVMTHGLRMRYDWVIYDAAALDHRWTQALLQAVGKGMCVISSEPGEQNEKVTEFIEQYGAVTVGMLENYQSRKKPVRQDK